VGAVFDRRIRLWKFFFTSLKSVAFAQTTMNIFVKGFIRRVFLAVIKIAEPRHKHTANMVRIIN